jgi:uncharacterized membrane protein
VWAIVLLACSVVRHELLQSTAFDLAIYDQVAYLMGRGDTPLSTVSDIHHMGNHAAYSFFAVGLLYALVPSSYWLFGVQALGLAAGAIPAWALAKQAGLNPKQSLAIAWAYLLYPVVFNVNVFDFHPEVMAIAGLLAAVWLGRANRAITLAPVLVWVMGCKAVLSITVAALGAWLLLFDRRRWPGLVALVMGGGWFLVVNQAVIPAYNLGLSHQAIGRYAYLGSSVSEAALSLVLKPHLVLGRLLSGDALIYLLLILGPVLPWLVGRRLGALAAAAPAIGLNVLSTLPEQRDLLHQYSLPVLPFLLVAAIDSLARGRWDWLDRMGSIGDRLRGWIASGRAMWVWALVGFLTLAKFGYFGSRYLAELDTWADSRAAIALIHSQERSLPLSQRGGILTTSHLAPHLGHRKVLRQTLRTASRPNWADYDHVLLNLKHPGWGSTLELAGSLDRELRSNPAYRVVFDRGGVVLFQRHPSLGRREESPRRKAAARHAEVAECRRWPPRATSVSRSGPRSRTA